MIEHLATQAVEGWLARYANEKNAERSGKVIRLRMPRIFVIIGCGALSMTVAALVQVIPEMKGTGLALTIIGGFALGAAGLIPLLYGLNHEVLVTEDGFHTKGPMSRTRYFDWSAVEKGRYSYLEKAMILTTADGSRVRIGVFLLGAKLFWRMLNERGGVSVGDLGLPYDYWR